MIRIRPVVVLASLLALALPAAALGQSNAERVLNDVYSRTHDYDLVHQKIELRDFDWDSTSFEGRVESTVVARAASLDSLVLDAGHLLGIRSVTDAAGGKLATGRHGDTLVVHLARAAAFGDTLRFTIDYHGKVQNGRGLTYIQPEGRPHRPRQIWSQGEAMDNHYWFPTYDFPNDKMSWELVATVPAGYTAVSNGALAGDRTNADGTRTMDWREDQPSATYLVSLVVAPLEKVHDEWNGKPVDYYVYKEDAPLARRLFHVTPDMIQVYSDLTGVPYPWAKYAQTTVADFFGGMENVSATTLVDWLPDARAYADRPWYQWILIPHELAHQWFGDYVTTEDWAHTWLNEGFAEFMPGQYWRVRAGDRTAEDYYMDEYTSFMRIDQRKRMPVVAEGSNNIYPKGALVLEMLRDYLGDRPFWAGLHRYLEDHAHGNATTDDLRQAFLQATGQNLDWFFSEWLYDAGYPELTVTTHYDAAAKRLTLVAAQTQQDSAQADSTALRFETPRVFRMPVTIRIGTASGDVLARDWIDQRTDTITVDGVASEPNMVVFDEGDNVLKTLDFRQPTTWLANELARDTTLWNRKWAIDQLAERKGDAAAGRALAAAATSADFFRTRAQAAEALGSFPAAVALAPLRTALQDTSAQVRAAALESLGEVGGPDAVALARRALDADSSYAVKAAAVVALAHADSAHAHAIIQQALGMPSYRDAIMNAALRAIGELHDASFVGQLSKMVGQGPQVAFTLGALAAHGSDQALDVLVKALNDPRADVRRSALTSIANTLEPGIALSRLKAAAAGLKYQDTKTMVDRLMTSLASRAQGH